MEMQYFQERGLVTAAGRHVLTPTPISYSRDNSRGWRPSVVIKSTVYSANMSHGCRFESRLLHFRSGFLLTHLRGQHEVAQVLSLSPAGRPKDSSWPQTSPVVASVHLPSSSVTLCFKYINLKKIKLSSATMDYSLLVETAYK